MLVTHYAPAYLTLEGEDPRIWPELGSRTMEKALLEARPDIAIHGHVHKSKLLEASLDGIRILNVAFPARGDIVVIEL
jgi:Icc-related predicted phosphoesterase